VIVIDDEDGWHSLPLTEEGKRNANSRRHRYRDTCDSILGRAMRAYSRSATSRIDST
jgi:hypothetical protein